MQPSHKHMNEQSPCLQREISLVAIRIRIFSLKLTFSISV